MVKPESQSAIPDSTVEFKASLKGTPPFKIKWFKEDLELVSGPNCLFGIEGSTGFLNLYSVDVSKSGNYTCQVSNDVGSDSCTTTLSITGVLMCSVSVFCSLLCKCFWATFLPALLKLEVKRPFRFLSPLILYTFQHNLSFLPIYLAFIFLPFPRTSKVH